MSLLTRDETKMKKLKRQTQRAFFWVIFIWVCQPQAHHPKSAYAFDYLEHLYLTDTICAPTLEYLINVYNQDASLDHSRVTERVIALALVCPLPQDRPYCADGVKQAIGSLTQLSAPPAESGEYSLTLGDLAAFPDHIGDFGHTPKLPRARKYGLTSRIIEWISYHDGGMDGTLEDVAEDACEGGDVVDWARVDQDLFEQVSQVLTGASIPQLRPEYLRSRSRAPLVRGPYDPAGPYSFDNPHYLDLIFRNHHHFGAHAFSAWLGFHSVGIDLSVSSCPSLIDLDADRLEDLADDWPQFEDTSWDDLSLAERSRQGCALLSHIFSTRLRQWFSSLGGQDQDRWLTFAPQLKTLVQRGTLSVKDQDFIERIISATLSLVYEGSGLHFLQDSLAGGHMRTIRTRGGLQEARYDHDEDNRDGVIAQISSVKGTRQLVAYGDSYILGYGPNKQEHSTEDSPTCDPPFSPEAGARCALRIHRGNLALVTIASLVDWAYGGLLFEVSPSSTRDHTAQSLISPLELVRSSLPTSPASSSAPSTPEPRLHRANLPIPPPDFSYQALSQRFGFDVAGSAPRLGIQLGLLDTLGDFAHWLSSYRLGLNVDLGQGDLNRWSVDLGYAFHFRWAARFTLDIGLFTHMGWREFDNDIDWYVGLSPSTGITLLPEGWLKIPLELNINYQLPLTFYDEGVGFPGMGLVEGHYFSIGLGLAFMR